MKPVYLQLSEAVEKLPCRASHFWGNPDLPSEYDYPVYLDEKGNEHPYVFICQINLEEVASYDVDNVLPHEGMLLFFAKIDTYLGDYISDDIIGGVISDTSAVKVLYFPSCKNLREVVYMNGESCKTVPHELKIEFHADLMHVSDEHALLAHPTYRPWENWDAPYEDWLILLQVDSFEGKDFQLNLMDVGVLDFLISPSDLKQHSFDNVRAIVLSS